MSGAPALDLIHAAQLFAHLPDAERELVAARLRPRRFGARSIIAREGEPLDALHLVVSGRGGLVSRDRIGREVALDVLEAGETFGESALLGHVRAGATVRALTDLETLALSREDHEAIAAACPELSRALRDRLDLLDVDAFLKRASPFARLSHGALWALAARLRPLAVTAGETVIREGAASDRFYLVRAGRFEASEGGERIAELGPGDCFGEIALLGERPAVLTVRALGDAALLALDKADFDALVRRHAPVRALLGELARIRYAAATGRRLGLPEAVARVAPYLRPPSGGRYWRLLVGGLAISAALSAVAASTADGTVLLAALVLTAFVGPLVYVSFLAETDLLATSARRLAASFLLGGAVGVPTAIALEEIFQVLPGEPGSAVLIGLIEESAKLVGVTWLLRTASLRFRMDGVIFGAAAGMGFAAFETVLYGLATLEEVEAAASGTLPVLAVLWARTALSPFGHGTWTAIVCAGLFAARAHLEMRSFLAALGAFAFAVLLHALWDLELPSAVALLWLVVIGLIGLAALRRMVRAGLREQLAAAAALNPALVDPGEPEDRPLTCGSCGQPAPTGTYYCVRCGSALRVEDQPA